MPRTLKEEKDKKEKAERSGKGGHLWQREQHGHGRQNTHGMFQGYQREQLNLNNNL